MKICVSEAIDVRIDEVEKRLRSLGIGETELPINTVRRWSAAKLLPKPESIYHTPEGGPGRYGEWPPETVEQAAAIHMARSCIQTATIKRVKATTLMQAKRLVTEFYAIVDEFNETGDVQALLKFETMLTPVELPDGRRGAVFGGWDLHALVITWIASLEKVRHGKPLFEPMIVSFNWNWHLVCDAGREHLKMKFDGVTFEPSDTEVVARRIGHTRDALAKRLGREPAKRTSELDTNSAIFDKNTNWDSVQIDTDRQLVIITLPEREDTVIIDMRGSGFKICSDDAEAGKSLYK